MLSFSVTTEDAYISFRYAENIASGYGIVFNNGGEVVEGYSNPTWVALLTLANIFGLNSVLAGRCLGLLFGALLLVEITTLFRLLRPERPLSGIYPALVFLTVPMFLFWTQTGLENSLFIWLVAIGMRLAICEATQGSKFPFSAIPYFFLAITRPEGIVFFAITCCWKIANNKSNDKLQGRSSVLLWAAIVIILFLAFELWRYMTFGEWVPNTFFAKVNKGGRHNLRMGTLYILGFLNHSAWIPVVLPFLIRLIFVKARLTLVQSRFIWLLALHTLALIAFILFVGRDIHPYDRFCVPFMLFSALAAFIMIPESVDNGRLGRASQVIIVAIFIIGNLAYSFPPAYKIEPPITRPPNMLIANIAGLINGRTSFNKIDGIIARFADPPVDALEFVGRDLRDNPDVNGLLAAEQCGKIPYYYGGPVLDLLGLNDSIIARIIHSNSTWDIYAREIFKHAPENFVMVYSSGHLISRYYIENTVLSLPFQNRYELDAIYHVDYYFNDLIGNEHSFSLELVRYRAKDGHYADPLTKEEEEWLLKWKDVDYSAENDDLYGSIVEAFRERIKDDPERLIEHGVHLN